MPYLQLNKRLWSNDMTTTILYVEDQPLNLRLVRRILMQYDFAVLEAMDGASGIVLAREHMPDLILMDILLPDMNGLEVSQHLKSLPETRNIPIVAITADVTNNYHTIYRNFGVDGFVNKPVTRNTLLNAIIPPLRSAGRA